MITKHNVHFLTHGYTIIPNALSPDEFKRGARGIRPSCREADDRMEAKSIAR